eukprot:2614153-Rhodomonas_salina.1
MRRACCYALVVFVCLCSVSAQRLPPTESQGCFSCTITAVQVGGPSILWKLESTADCGDCTLLKFYNSQIGELGTVFRD